MHKEKVAIIGFGYIGTVIGAVLADKGFDIYGIDTSQYIIDSIKSGKSPYNEPGLDELIAIYTKNGRLKISHDASIIKDCSVYIITVGTPLSDDFTADMSQIHNAIKSILPYLSNDALLILKSTVPPFTTSDYIASIVEATGLNVKLAFCPERMAEGNAIKDFMTIPVVVGGINDESTDAAAEFWRCALNVEIISVDNSTVAEFVKLADNLWIDLNIALANELAKLADKMSVDVLQVIYAANSLPKGSSNVNILTPSVGVGGYCLTKDPWFVQHFGNQYDLKLFLPKTGRIINDSMPYYSDMLIDDILKKKVYSAVTVHLNLPHFRLQYFAKSS